MVIVMNFERLFFLREEQDLFQNDMANILNVKQVNISNWENSKEIIPLTKLNIYANYFNVSLDYIMKLSDKKIPSINRNDLDKTLIGKNIKIIRMQNNLSQQDLANVLNTTKSTIWAYETGKTLILTAFAYQICVKYNVSMDWLCGRVDNKSIK